MGFFARVRPSPPRPKTKNTNVVRHPRINTYTRAQQIRQFMNHQHTPRNIMTNSQNARTKAENARRRAIRDLSNELAKGKLKHYGYSILNGPPLRPKYR
jgi:hypothetical protein